MATTDFEPMELNESRHSKERMNRQSTGTRQWLCKWEDRFGDWVPKIRVTRYTEGIDPSDVSSYESRLYCDSIDRQGVGAGRMIGSVQVPNDCCKLTVEYAEKQPYNEELEEWSSSGGRMVKAILNGVITVKPVPQAKYQLVKYFVYSPNNAVVILGYMDRVNNEANWRGLFPKGTLRFNAPDITRFYDTNMGTLLQKVVFNFTYDPGGWNNNWIEGYWVPQAVPAHQYGNFDTLINPGLGAESLF